MRLIDTYWATHGLETPFVALAQVVRTAARRDGKTRQRTQAFTERLALATGMPLNHGGH